MRPLSEAASRISKQNFSRKYIAIGRIVNHWDEIVGADLAQKAQPVKINYRKQQQQKRGQKPQATLEIASSTADATLLHYQQDLILERINQVFGERWITALRFVPIASNTSSTLFKVKKRLRPLSANETKILSQTLDSIVDPDIKLRLESLGQAIILQDQS